MTRTDEPAPTETRRRRGMPDAYVVLVGIMLAAAAATWVVPAGEFARVPGPDGRETIDPDSYQRVEQSPAGLLEILTAVPTGIIEAGEVVVFTLMIGGAFGVLRATGIVGVVVGALAHRFARRGILVVPALMVGFAALGTVIGTQELSLVYIPVIVPLMIALRFDSVTAAAVALCATTAGFAAGVINPINTGLAQTIAGVPLYSGTGLRLVAWVGLTAVAVLVVMRYARRVRRNPSASLLADDPAEQEKRDTYLREEIAAPTRMTTRQRVASVTLVAFLAVLVWGVLAQGWFFVEMSGLFIVLGVVVGLVSGLSLTRVCEGFNVGFREVLVGALIAGVARGVAVILEDGRILDTIVVGLGVVAGALPPALAAVGMFGAQALINFFVPSGSGQALVTMPIMAPLADVLDMTRQTAVLAYQLGDGVGTLLFPTSGYFMAALALAGVPWHRWVRFFLPVLAGWLVVALGLLVYAQLSGWA